MVQGQLARGSKPILRGSKPTRWWLEDRSWLKARPVPKIRGSRPVIRG